MQFLYSLCCLRFVIFQTQNIKRSLCASFSFCTLLYYFCFVSQYIFKFWNYSATFSKCFFVIKLKFCSQIIKPQKNIFVDILKSIIYRKASWNHHFARILKCWISNSFWVNKTAKIFTRLATVWLFAHKLAHMIYSRARGQFVDAKDNSS